MMEIAFWGLVAIVFYVYAGYPLVLLLVAPRLNRPVSKRSEETPSVTLLISAFNEEKWIAQKLDNCLQLDYPVDRLQTVVISDASTDLTDATVAEYEEKGVTLLRMEQRGGKTLGLNVGVKNAQNDIVVFSDANAMYARDAVRALVAPFADPQVGAVIGESRYVESHSDAARSETLYWRYEKLIKLLESRCGSVVGGDGAIYAVRRSLYQPMTADSLSDFVNPLQVVQKGYRCVYEPGAFSYEETAGAFAGEYRRKVRIVNRGWRALMSMRDLLNPFRYGLFSWQLISHKLLRWLVPLFLFAAFLLNILLLAQHSVYWLTLFLQILFYGLAAVGALLRGRDLAIPLYIPYYFCLVNIASARGIIEAFRGKTYTTWSTARMDG